LGIGDCGLRIGERKLGDFGDEAVVKGGMVAAL